MKRTPNGNCANSARYRSDRELSDLYTVESRDSDGTTPDDVARFPLALIANVAAKLHKEGDSYAFTAQRAVGLVDACRESLAFAVEELKEFGPAQSAEEFVDELNQKFGLGLTDADKPIPFIKAIKAITGHTIRSRAETDFISFLKVWMGVDGSSGGKRELAERFKAYEAQGITPIQFSNFADHFADARDNGKLGKRRRPQKKNLGASKKPKTDTKAKPTNSNTKRAITKDSAADTNARAAITKGSV